VFLGTLNWNAEL